MRKIFKILFKIIIIFLALTGILVCLFVAIIANVDIDHADYCIEDGDCGIGRVIKTPEGDIIISKETCLEQNWKWDEKRQECKVAYVIQWIKNIDTSSEIDYCLDRGFCWDYIRGRCETENQGYCVKTPERCVSDFHGEWDYIKQYCILNKD